MPETVTEVFCKKVFLKISQNTLVIFCKFCEITKSTFSYRKPPVDASVMQIDLY